MINVLVVEDSRVVRDYLVHVLETDPAIRVIDVAADGEEALASVGRRRPDVILMDIHLPGMDGFEVTRRIMSSHPVPIVVCTASMKFDQVHTAMEALEAGALAVLRKPRGFGDPDAHAELAAIIDTLKLMSEIKLVRRPSSPLAPTMHGAGPPATGPAPGMGVPGGVSVVAVGASTGGPPALLQILSHLPPGFPAPVLVVQHVAAGFTAGLADWLAAGSGRPVHVATDGEIPLPGHVYLAADDHHLRVGPGGGLEITRSEAHHGLRPSVGILFRSVAERFGRRAIGVLLTGMGRDGAEELKIMADQGAPTIAQSEESCVVFGMPAEAIRLGAASYVLPPREIADFLAAAVRPKVDQGGD